MVDHATAVLEAILWHSTAAFQASDDDTQDTLPVKTTNDDGVISDDSPQANEALRREVDDMLSSASPLVLAQQQKAEWQADMDKFQKLIENLQASRRWRNQTV